MYSNIRLNQQQKLNFLPPRSNRLVITSYINDQKFIDEYNHITKAK